MTVDSVLDNAFALLLQKAQRPEREPSLRPGGIVFEWTGGGQPLDATMMDPVLVEVPFPARLVWAHMYAGDSAGGAVEVQATIELRLTSFNSFGTSSAVYGTGARPGLDTAAAVNLSLDGWQSNFVIGDTLIAYPTVFTGTATWLALTLQLRPTGTDIGVDTVTDNAGTNMTFNDGSAVEFRS